MHNSPCDRQRADGLQFTALHSTTSSALSRIEGGTVSPIARALTKNREGDSVMRPTPGGLEALEILSVEYRALDTHLAPSHTQLTAPQANAAAA